MKLGHGRAQRRALDEAHRVERPVGIRQGPQLKYGHDSRVLKLAGDPGLAQES